MKHAIDFFHAVENKKFFKDIPIVLEESYTFRANVPQSQFSHCVAKMMFSLCDLGAWMFNFVTKDFFVSEKFGSVLGYSSEDLELMNIQNIKKSIHPEDLIELQNCFSKHLNGISNTLSCLIRIQNKNKNWMKVYIKGRLILEDDIEKSNWIFGIILPVDDLVEQQDELRDLANYDSLTKLPNRKFLKEQLSIAIKNAEKDQSELAICFIDLNGFKAINDNYGHHIGDKFLCEIANALKKSVRTHDIVARLGGDEFVVVFNRIKDRERLLCLLERLSRTCHKSIVINNHKFSASASIGVVIYPEIKGSVDELISFADKSMYQSKFTKNQKYTFFTEIDDSSFKKNDPNYLFQRLVNATHNWFE